MQGQPSFDVVTVPDFSGAACRRFEARTLFFLGSWIENAGLSRSFPLHLACIGEPPPSVLWLSDQCHANITVHDSMRVGAKQSINKLRGLEITGKTPNVLLLDTDVLILNDLIPLGTLVQPTSISAAPGEIPRIPEEYWKRIYSTLGIEFPAERIKSTEVELGIDRFGQGAFARATSMLPYYNSGVVFLPWSAAGRMHETWRKSFIAVSDLFVQAKDPAWPKLTDEAALSLAIQSLKQSGIAFERLPMQFHTGWRHLYTRTLRLTESAIFHMTSSFRNLGRKGNGYDKAILAYQKDLFSRYARVWLKSGTLAQKAYDFWALLLPGTLDLTRIGYFLNGIYQRQVCPALAQRAQVQRSGSVV